MDNLKKYGVQEMSAKELREVDSWFYSSDNAHYLGCYYFI